jgi:cadmium resistance protein CadD (predicted permease)
MNKYLLITASIYLGAVGLALLLVPVQFGVDAVPEDASSELIALLRLLGGPFLGIAVLNWMSRNADPSAVRNTVVLANLVGFGVVAANDVVGVASGSARDLAKVFVIVHLTFAVAFAVSWARSRTTVIQSEWSGS